MTCSWGRKLDKFKIPPLWFWSYFLTLEEPLSHNRKLTPLLSFLNFQLHRINLVSLQDSNKGILSSKWTLVRSSTDYWSSRSTALPMFLQAPLAIPLSPASLVNSECPSGCVVSSSCSVVPTSLVLCWEESLKHRALFSLFIVFTSSCYALLLFMSVCLLVCIASDKL